MYMNKQYFGPPFYFCISRNPNYDNKMCNGIIQYVEPKKVKVFKKVSTTMKNSELQSWYTKFKYR